MAVYFCHPRVIFYCGQQKETKMHILKDCKFIPMGETFQYGARTLRASKPLPREEQSFMNPSGEFRNPCSGCFFEGHLKCFGCDFVTAECLAEYREDKADVIFVEAEG